MHKQSLGINESPLNVPAGTSQKCESCKIEVNYNSNCPLCGKHINGGARAGRYPAYYISGEVRLKALLRFLFVLAGVAVLLIDFLTQFQGWSVVCAGGLVIVWFALIKAIFDRVGFPAIMVQVVLVIVLWAVIMEVVGGTYRHWPITYIIPSAVGFGIAAIIFSTLFKRVKWGEIGIYTTILSLINLAVVILGILKVNFISDVTVAICVLGFSVIFLSIFKYFLSKSFNESFKKKFRV